MMGDRAGRWFHTLVVVGTAMTACGGNTAVEAPPGPDAGRAGAQPVVVGKDASRADGAATSGPDAAVAGDASLSQDAASQDAAAMAAMCCTGAAMCRLNDAGAPLCGPGCLDYCCGPYYNYCIQ